MKRNFVIAILLLSNYLLSAQEYQFDAAKLTKEYAARYAQTNPEDFFFDRMSFSLNNFFLVDSAALYEAAATVSKKYKLSPDSVAFMVFDTLMKRFTDTYIWEGKMDLRARYLSYMKFYSDRMCNCITEKVKADPKKAITETAAGECVEGLVKDTAYIQAGQRISLAIGITAGEVMEMARMAGVYLFLECPAMKTYFIDALRNEVVYNMLGKVNDRMYYLDRTALDLYTAKSASLAKIFPAYKQFEAYLKQAAAFKKANAESYLIDKVYKPDGSVEITSTYAEFSKENPSLKGQVIVVANNPFECKILSYRFVSADKIKDAKKLLERIKETEMLEPPPAMEELKEIKIN